MLSAQRGDGVDRLLDLVDQVAAEHRQRIPTAQLNRFFAEVIEEMPPPLHHGRAIRIHYITQARDRGRRRSSCGRTRPRASRRATSGSSRTGCARPTASAARRSGSFVKARKDRHDQP